MKDEVEKEAKANLAGGYPDYEGRPRRTIEELIADIDRITKQRERWKANAAAWKKRAEDAEWRLAGLDK